MTGTLLSFALVLLLGLLNGLSLHVRRGILIECLNRVEKARLVTVPTPMFLSLWYQFLSVRPGCAKALLLTIVKMTIKNMDTLRMGFSYTSDKQLCAATYPANGSIGLNIPVLLISRLC